MKEGSKRVFDEDSLRELCYLWEFKPQWRNISALARRFKCDHSTVIYHLVKRGLHKCKKYPIEKIKKNTAHCPKCGLLKTSIYAKECDDKDCPI